MNRKAILIVLALLLLGALTLMIATAETPGQGLTPPPVATASVYADPQGRFTVPVPTNWSVRQVDGYGLLTDPDGEITMYAIAALNPVGLSEVEP